MAETLEPGATVRDVAPRFGIQPSQLSRWRRLMKDGELVLAADGDSREAIFAPLVLFDGEASAPDAGNRAA